jgi:YesN/AraC family two-component response regulator
MVKTTLFPNQLLTEHRVPKPYAYYFRQWSTFDMPFHRHDTMEIMYLMQGTCHIEFEESGHPVQSIVLKKGEFVILDANMNHRLLVSNQEYCQMLNVEFSFEYQNKISPSMQELLVEEPELRELWTYDKKIVKLSDPDEVFSVMKSLVLELDKSTSNRMMVHMLFCQLMIRLSRIFQETYHHLKSPATLYILEVIKYLQQHLEENIHIDHMAAHVNLHPTYLQQIFKLYTQMTMIEYLTMLRMEKAKKLLLHTQIPIIEISNYVGIGSRPYFHYMFKKYCSLTPLAFRQSMHTHQALEGADKLEFLTVESKTSDKFDNKSKAPSSTIGSRSHGL